MEKIGTCEAQRTLIFIKIAMVITCETFASFFVFVLALLCRILCYLCFVYAFSYENSHPYIESLRVSELRELWEQYFVQGVVESVTSKPCRQTLESSKVVRFRSFDLAEG